MTVSATTPYVAYAGAGTSGPFAIPFRFLANADLGVTKIDASGATIVLTGNTITGAGDDDGGELYTAAPVAVGETLRIYRATTRAQTAQYVANGPFPAATHERALDKAMLIDQEQDRDIGRSLRVPLGEVALPLPPASQRGGRILGFDGDGNPVALTPEYAGSGVEAISDAIVGLTMSNNITLPNVAIDLSAGSCKDRTGHVPFNLLATLTKRLDASWAPGSGLGGLDSGTVTASTFYNVFLIHNPATLALDALFSKSFNNPLLPAGFTSSRYVGSLKTDGSSVIRPFLNVGEWFWFKTSVVDVFAVPNAAAAIRLLSVPKGAKSRASLGVVCYGTSDAFLAFRDPDLGNYPLDDSSANWFRRSAASPYFIATIDVETDNLGRIYTSSTSTNPDEVISIKTNGWAVDRSVYR